MTALLFPIITTSSMKVANILATSAINLLFVQPTNCFMATLSGLVGHVDDGAALTALLVVHNGGSRGGRRCRRGGRSCEAVLRWVLVLSLAGISTALLLFQPGDFRLEYWGGAMLVLYFGAALFFVCSVAVWDILVRPCLTARRGRHVRTNALPPPDRAGGNPLV